MTSACWVRCLVYLVWAPLGFVLAGSAAGAEVKCIPETGGNPRHVLYQGGVDPDDPPKLRSRMADCFPTNVNVMPTIWLNSPGGSVAAGLEMANYIIDYSARRPVRVAVVPGARCVSACTFIFIAGEFREVSPVATFEPHGFSGWSGPNPSKVEKWSAEDREPNLRRLMTATVLLAQHFSGEGLNTQPFGTMVSTFSSGGSRNYGQLQQAFLGMPKSYRDIVADWDGVLQASITEVERQTALRTLLGSPEEQSAQVQAQEVERMSSAITTRLTVVLDKHLNKGRKGRKQASETEAQQEIKALIASQIEGTTKTAISLGKLMNRRQSDIDVRALTNFMFSTSILYVRPLTREEMCDANVMNVGC